MKRLGHCVLVLTIALAAKSHADDPTTWTGGATNDSWSTAANWSAGVPTAANAAIFAQAGSGSLPNIITNVLDSNRTIGGLAYQFSSAFHTSDLGGFTLTVLGNLDMNSDVGSAGTATIRNGNLVIDSPLGSINVARGFQANAAGTLSLAGLASLNVKTGSLQVGTTAGPSVRGTLFLAESNMIEARSIDVGRSSNSTQEAIGTLELGRTNVILVGELNISRDSSTGIVTLPAGGSLRLGSAERRVALTVGRLDRDSSADGRLDVSAGRFDAFLSDLTVAQKAAPGNNLRGAVLGGNAGDIRIGAEDAPGNVRVGYQLLGASSSTGIVDFSRQDSLTAHLNQLSVGSANPQNVAIGTFHLPASNTIFAKKIEVGVNGERQNQLTLGRTNNIQTDEFVIGAGNATGIVTLPAGGSLVLGSETRPARVAIGNGILTNGQSWEGRLELNGNDFRGFLDGALIVGHREGPPGATTGTFKAGNGGSLVLGKSGNTADLIVGRGRGGGVGVGLADFSGLATLSASVNQLHVGHSTAARARGVLHLADENNIDARSVIVGRADSASNPQGTGENSGLLTLGTTNRIVTDELQIGRDLSNGLVQFRGNGSLSLGSEARPTAVSIGSLSVGVNTGWDSKLDLSGGSFNAFLRDVVVGQKSGGPGTITGSFLAGNSGTISMGTSSTTANLIVGTSVDGGVAIGTADFSGLSNMSAHLNQLYVGVGRQGQARGTLHLPAATVVNAKEIIVGANILETSEQNLVTLGTTTNILTDKLAIGRDFGNGTMRFRAGGTLSLGSAERRTNLFVGQSNTNTNSAYAAKLDLAGGAFNAFLDNLIVGEKDGGPGVTSASIIGGNGGALNIGTAGNTANIIIGRSLNGGVASGLVDLSALNSLTANVNQLLIGVAPTNAGTAIGTLRLPQTSTIDAKSIVVGEFGNSENLLRLGSDTTIVTDELIVAKQRSYGRVELPAGGIFRLGSHARPANLTIGDTVFNTAGIFYTGEVDLGGGTFIANLNNVVIAKKDVQQGAVNGTLTIGPSAGNSVQAGRISIGLGPGIARGTLNFGGGLLAADVIERGDGTAAFNWTGGTLRVNSFGNGAQPFDLNNTGSGRLSPGNPTGTTNIRGNYVQGPAATAQFDLGGTTPGTSHDQVNITGTAGLAGTLDVRVSGGFTPVLGNTFDLITFASRSGMFQNVLLPVLPGPTAFQLDYSAATKVTLRMVTPQSLEWIGAAPSGAWSTAANWNRASAPTTSSDAQLKNATASDKQAVLDANSTVHRVTIGGSGATMSLVVPSERTLLATDRIVVEEGGRLDLLRGNIISSAIELAGGTLRGGGTTATPVIVEQGTIDVPDTMQDLTLESPVTINSGGALTKTGPGQLKITGPITGGSMTTGAGTTVARSVMLANLTLAGSASTFRLQLGSGTAVLNSLSLAGGNVPTATFDLTNNALVLDYSGASPAVTVRAQLLAGRGGPGLGADWIGKGITSSAAAAANAAQPDSRSIGYADNSTLPLGPYTDFRGKPADDTSILIAFTSTGDANLDGVVNDNDVTIVGASYAPGVPQPSWALGDFDYNGFVDDDDVTLLGAFYDPTPAPTAVSIPSAAAIVAAVPEPGSAMLVATALVGLAVAAVFRRV